MKTLIFTLCSWTFAVLLFTHLASPSLMPHHETLIMVVFALVMAPLVASSVMGPHYGDGSDSDGGE